VITALSRFKKVSLAVSLEGVGAHNDYLRYGSSWQQLDNTIQKLRSTTTWDILIGHVLQHTSIYTLPALVAYADEIGLYLYCNAIYDPRGHLTIHSVGDQDAAGFSTTNANAQGWFGTRQFDTDLHRQFRDYVAMLDQIRGTDFRATFNPKWY
jgi:hypothetical protein